ADNSGVYRPVNRPHNVSRINHPSSPRPAAPHSDTVSDDDLYPVGPGDHNDSASRVPAPDSRQIISLAIAAARSSSSRTSLPAQQPNETDDQYDARYAANIRCINRTEEAWARPYAAPNGPPSHMSAEANRDVRFERPNHASELPTQPAYTFEARLHPDSASRAPGSNLYTGRLPIPPPSASAYRVTQGPVTNGLWNNDQYHYVVLLGKITQLINHKVGATIEAPHGVKQPKLAEPPKYSGSHSHDEFVDWLSSFLNWLRGHYISGPATDPIRVTYLGLYIEGAANDWYLTEIDNPLRHYDPALLFADCICLMHRRFVRTATANDAAIKYNSVRYVPADGVEGLYYKLDTAAERMIERPNDYDFRRRLFNSLPRWLHDKLMDRNIIPEYSSLADIRENAKQLEENSLRRYEGIGEIGQSLGRVSINSRPPRTTDAIRGARGNANAVPNTSAPPVARAAAPAATHNQRAPAAITRPSRPPRDTSTMTCFSCGKIGHISTEPKCENYDTNRMRLHAQREASEDSGGDIHESPPDCLNETEADLDTLGVEDQPPSWGGSQYESDTELYREETGDLGNEAEAPRLASMHIVRMAVMRTMPDEDFPVVDDNSGNDEMPALESCSESDDEGAPTWVPRRSPRPISRQPLPVGHIIGVRYITTEDHYDSEAESSSEDSTPVASTPLPTRACASRMVADLRESWTRLPSIPTQVISDRGMPLEGATLRSSLDFADTPRYVDDAVPILEAPELASNHLRWLTAPRRFNIISHAVWLDMEARIIDLADDEQLGIYNRQLSLVASCPICGGACQPTVFQVLHTVGTDISPPLHINLFSCSQARPTRSSSSSSSPEQDFEDGRYADPHGDYDEESMYAMRISYSSNVRRQPVPGEITRPRHNQETITAVITINGHEALALFDSGSTTDSITPEFGFVSRTKQFKLDEQIVLQLGCVGSRSKISYGVVAPVTVFSVTEEMYFDVVNIDRYDAILGTPFLKKHGVCIDFGNRGVVIGGVLHKTFSLAEELAFLSQKGEAIKHTHKRPAPRETAPIQPKRLPATVTSTDPPK
ncbi:hypothetical protein HWV62_24808, partial [Athelia sp. TMB]